MQSTPDENKIMYDECGSMSLIQSAHGTGAVPNHRPDEMDPHSLYMILMSSGVENIKSKLHTEFGDLDRYSGRDFAL